MSLPKKSKDKFHISDLGWFFWFFFFGVILVLVLVFMHSELRLQDRGPVSILPDYSEDDTANPGAALCTMPVTTYDYIDVDLSLTRLQAPLKPRDTIVVVFKFTLAPSEVFRALQGLNKCLLNA